MEKESMTISVDALRAATTYASSDAERSRLMGVALNHERKTIIAADGYRLIEFPSIRSTLTRDVIVPSGIIERICRIAETKMIDIEFDEDIWRVRESRESDSFSIRFDPIKGPYPEIEHMPGYHDREQRSTIMINVEYLAELCSAALSLGAEHLYIEAGSPLDGVRFEPVAPNTSSRETSRPLFRSVIAPVANGEISAIERERLERLSNV